MSVSWTGNYREPIVLLSDSDDEKSEAVGTSKVGEGEAILADTDEEEEQRLARNRRQIINPPKNKKHQIAYLSDSSGSFERALEALNLGTRETKKKQSQPPPKEQQEQDDDDDDVIEVTPSIPSKSNQTRQENGCTTRQDEPESAWVLDDTEGDYFLKNGVVSGVTFPSLRVPRRFYDELYEQQTGIQWLASPYHSSSGHHLMGMGKTYTSLSFVGGMMKAGTIRNGLVISPLSVMRSWEKEANKILPKFVRNIQITVLPSSVPAYERRRILNEASRQRFQSEKQRRRQKCHLVITTYGLVRNAQADFDFGDDADPWNMFNIVVLDEAHTIKNPKAAITKSCHAICKNPETRRLMLTGTPLMNKLFEVWSLFDFATSGQVLGDRKSFDQRFGKPIEAARDRDAPEPIIRLGERKNKELHYLIKPYLLQRLKIDYLSDKLPPKTDLVVWTHLSDEQRDRYSAFLEDDDKVYSILRGEQTSPLVAISALKKLCSHPILFDQDASAVSRSHKEILAHSAKLGLLVSLLRRLRFKEHRTLVFSQSTKMLDIIQNVLRTEKIAVSRIDGSVKELDRQSTVDEFNAEKSLTDVMLLSTMAAGVGLTLTGADTVIVYDPSWTPSLDAQAIDRAYRIGQDKPVSVYRLIAAGTVEEKIYERQIHKDGLKRTVFGSTEENVERYFQRSELAELFKLGDPGVCACMEKVQEASGGRFTGWRDHQFVLDMPGVVGISRHDGFYTLDDKNDDSGDSTKKSSAFGGTVSGVGGGYKVKGKAARVLQRLENTVTKPVNSMKQNQGPPKHLHHKATMVQDSHELLKQLRDAIASGKRKKAMKTGVEMLESNLHNTLSESEKLELHTTMAQLAECFGLLS